MSKKKRKCENCIDCVVYCGDCNKVSLALTGDEICDVQSAITFFLSDYPDKSARVTKAAMRKILKKTWTAIRAST